jgi:hypothetical protein
MAPHVPIYQEFVGLRIVYVANVDVVPSHHRLYASVESTASLYNRAAHFYLQGLIEHARYGEACSVDRLRHFHSKMVEHLQLGWNQLHSLPGVEAFYGGGRMMSLAKTEEDIVQSAKYMFRRMEQENPHWFARRTPEWYGKQAELEAVRAANAAFEEKCRTQPRPSLLKPRKDVVERFRRLREEMEAESAARSRSSSPPPPQPQPQPEVPHAAEEACI